MKTTVGDAAPRSTATSLSTNNMAGVKDRIFQYVSMGFGLLVLLLIVWIGYGLYRESALTREKFGWSILTNSTWDIVHDTYGALAFIYGTVVSSLLALIIAVPLGIGAAIFLTEIAPRWLAAPISFVIELLAAVPSVIFGLWGFLVVCPWLQEHIYPWLTETFGSVPLFAPPAYITNVFAAGVILAIMILPFITSVSREVIRTVPASQREAALGLGATRWETISSVVLKGAKSGITGAIILALGRAIGETMAVVMVIGNNPSISSSLLQPGYTMPSLLANQFNESADIAIQRSALIEIAFILFVITLTINALARLLILLGSRNVSAGGQASAEHPAMERIREITGLGVRFAALAAIVIFFALQIFGDVRHRGPRGLFGPLELALITFGLIQVGKSMIRHTPNWSRWRKAVNGAMQGVLSFCSFAACLMLGLLLGYVAAQGIRSLNVNFFVGDGSKPPDDPTGGMKNGIVGTLVLVGIASSIGIPIGLMGGIFLSEYGSSRIGGFVRFSADVLNGIPSVVMGMFAYAAFVLPFKHFSAAAGGAALGIMMLPTIMRTTEEMLRLVPNAMREASLGLGATRVRTIRTVVLPAARAGIITGIMLTIARIAGETAPLLFTAFGNPYVSTRLDQPISSMTMMIYRYATSAYPEWIQQAWAGALMLLLLVLVISLLARAATRNKYAMR